jgi:hypothetical protein
MFWLNVAVMGLEIETNPSPEAGVLVETAGVADAVVVKVQDVEPESALPSMALPAAMVAV